MGESDENKIPVVSEQLEIEVLLIFWNFSDQFGLVDIPKAAAWAKEKLGIIIPLTPFVFTQKHYDFLLDRKVLRPDLRETLRRISKGILRDLPPPGMHQSED